MAGISRNHRPTSAEYAESGHVRRPRQLAPPNALRVRVSAWEQGHIAIGLLMPAARRDKSTDARRILLSLSLLTGLEQRTLRRLNGFACAH